LRSICFLALLIAGGAMPANAQSYEAGGSLAVSCRGSDGSFCRDESLATTGVYGSVWFADRFEIALRAAWMTFDDIEGILPFGISGTFAIRDASRRVTQAETVWHFRRGGRVRPMVGIAVGWYADRDVVTCQPPGCEPFLRSAGLETGERHDTERDGSIMVGLSVLATPRLRVRGGWRYHNPFVDELALSELFVAAGYRFGAQ
jgi:hypothetical protein